MDVPVVGVAHQAGTCLFGTDPAASVLGVNCSAPTTTCWTGWPEPRVTTVKEATCPTFLP